MKFSPALLFAVAAASDDKKVPPRHPLQRLNRLNEFTEEMLNAWFEFLPSKDAWVAKFAANGERMATNFQRGNQRCGFYDEEQLPHGLGSTPYGRCCCIVPSTCPDSVSGQFVSACEHLL